MINNHYAVQSTGITGVKVMAEVPVKRFKDGTSVSIDAKYFHSTNHHDRCFRSHPTVGLNIKKTWGLPRRR
jgi:hypothetical protein